MTTDLSAPSAQYSRYILPGLLCMVVWCATILFAASSFAAQTVNKLAVSFDLERHELQGTSRITLQPEESVTLRTGGLVVSEVLVNGSNLQPESAEDSRLHIPSAGSEQEVEISYSAKFPETQEPQRSLISEKGIVLLDTWYPLVESDVKVELTALLPKGFSAVSEADVISTEQTSTGENVHLSFSRPLPFIHFIAGPYIVEQEEFGEGKILASYFFPEDKELAAQYREKTKQYLERYEKLIGPYPYSRYSIVENRLPTGFAMPTFTLLGQSVVHLPFIVDTSLGHEVLHSWFGNAVNVDYKQGNWCEGLTTYLADHAFKDDKGEGSIFRKGQMVKYMSHISGDDNEMSVREFKSAGDHGPASQTNRVVGYNKVSMIFHMLHQKMGEEKFIEALRSFYEKNKYTYAGWQEIEEVFSDTSGLDLQPYFEQWLERTDIPVLSLRNIDIEEQEEAIVLSFDLVQKNKQPYWLSVPVTVVTEAGVTEERIEISELKTPVALNLTDYPQKIIVDKNYDLMRKLSPEEIPPVWSRFQGASEKIAIRADGVADLYEPLEKILTDMDCTVVSEDEFDDAQLSTEAVLFLGTTSKASRSIFAAPVLPDSGFTLEVRDNPVKANGVAVLVTAADKEQVQAVAHKLRHYGKYGYLHFEDGKIQTKRVPETAQGQEYQLDQPPMGVVVEQRSDFDTILDQIADARVVYVGETHVSQSDHLLQLRVIRALHKRYPDLAIGMEMFNKSVQESLDKYINKELEERQFIKESEYFKNWGYDYRLYRDIMMFARRHSLPVVALNLDKKIVSNTFRKGGISGLTEEEKEGLPVERDLGLAGYKERLGKAFSGHSGPHFSADKMVNFIQAQALWDETMAQSVADYLKENPAKKMVVLAGSGHVYKDTGMPPRVSRRIDVKQAVVLNVKENELEAEAADYAFFSTPIEKRLSPLLGVMLNKGEEGLTIAAFSHGRSGAKEAGLMEKDLLLEIDGEEIGSIEDVKLALLYKEYGETVPVKVKRPVFLLPDAVIDFEVKL